MLETLSVIKTIVLEEDLQNWYSVDGSKPVTVIEFILTKEGLYSKRLAFTIFDALEKIGGL